jgi:tetratricopeptide (TPR) repeat protein
MLFILALLAYAPREKALAEGKVDQPTAQKDKIVETTKESAASRPKIDPAVAQQAGAMLGQAIQLSNRNQWVNCIALCNKILALTPNNPEAYHTRGLAYERAEKYPEAISDLSRAISIKGDKANRETWIGRGDCYLATDHTDLAIKDYDRAVKLHPNFSGGYLRRAQLNCENKHYDAAINDADQLVKLEPKQGWAVQTRAMILYEAGRYKAAIDDYGQLIKISPSLDRAYISRARAYEKLGQFALAAKDREKARQISRQMME